MKEALINIVKPILQQILKIRLALRQKKARRVKAAASLSAAKQARGSKAVRSMRLRGKPRKLSVFALTAEFFRRTPKKLLIAGGAVALIVCVALVLIFSPKAPQGAQTAMAGGVPQETVIPSDMQTYTPETSPYTIPTTPPEETEMSPVNTTIKQGMTAPVVADIQQRLMDLNYMDSSEPTELYGPNTKQAVALFQREADITVDGCMGPETYSQLMDEDAPKYVVGVGDKGTDVKEMEDRLYELGYIEKASDTFSEDTEAAVKKFQQLNGLSADGKIGADTMEMLYSDDVKANFLSSGETSDKVLTCQKRLKALGYLTTTPDGKYGKDTTAAVKLFQGVNGLIVDGYLGPKTISLLNSNKAQSNVLMLGMSGSSITNVQKRLVTLKYMSKETGYYGSVTVEAVKSFQKQNRLHVDGKVGKNTMNVLMSDSAKKAPTGSGGSSGGSGGDSGSGSDTGDDSSVTAGVENFISVAETKLGCPYVRGGKGPNSFDCSGFVYWSLNHAGVVQSYMTSASWQKCTKYQRIEGMSNLKRGDVISFEGHVGIYMGGGEMINALPDGGVKISKNIMNSSYWKSHFVCGFRIF